MLTFPLNIGRQTDWCCLVTKLCPTFCDPMYCSPPGSSVHGILQARILEWVAMPSSRSSSWSRNQTCACFIGRWILYPWAIREAESHTGEEINANSPQRSSFPLSSWQLCKGLGHGSEFAQKKSQVILLLGSGGPLPLSWQPPLPKCFSCFFFADMPPPSLITRGSITGWPTLPSWHATARGHHMRVGGTWGRPWRPWSDWKASPSSPQPGPVQGKQILALHHFPSLWGKWDNCRKSSSRIPLSLPLHIIAGLVWVHMCVCGLHEMMDLRVWKWVMWSYLHSRCHLYGYSSYTNTEPWSFFNPNTTPLLSS